MFINNNLIFVKINLIFIKNNLIFLNNNFIVLNNNLHHFIFKFTGIKTYHLSFRRRRLERNVIKLRGNGKKLISNRLKKNLLGKRTILTGFSNLLGI